MSFTYNDIIMRILFLIFCLTFASPPVAALEVGDKLEEFSLRNAFNQRFHLRHMIEYGPVLFAFYHGGWSSESRERLRELQKIMPNLKAMNVHLVAISPEKPSMAQKTIFKQKLGFHILHDHHNQLAQSWGVLQTIPSAEHKAIDRWMKETHDTSLAEVNENYKDTYKLPRHASILVDEQGKIRFLDIPNLPGSSLPQAAILKTLDTMKATKSSYPQR